MCQHEQEGNGPSTGRALCGDLPPRRSRFPPEPALPSRPLSAPAPPSPVRHVLGGVLLVAGGGQDDGGPRRAQAPVCSPHPQAAERGRPDLPLPSNGGGPGAARKGDPPPQRVPHGPEPPSPATPPVPQPPEGGLTTRCGCHR